MSAPGRFQVGDTVRCVNATGWQFYITEGQEYEVVSVDEPWVRIVTSDGKVNGYRSHRFVLVSRPTPPALDPFAWRLPLELARSGGPLVECWQYPGEAWVAWSRFCYWATSVNLAAHFLPTQPAARTRASNGRDVPAATVLVELPVDVVEWWADLVSGETGGHGIAAACRRALGGGA